jgi:transposase
MGKTHVVTLSDDERAILMAQIQKGHGSARVIRRAHTLLLADEQVQKQEIARMLHVSSVTVGNTCRRYVRGGLEQALFDDPRPGAERKLDGRQEAHLVAMVCGDPPEGHEDWSLRLIADRVVELGMVEAISHETIRRMLKKTRSNPG